MARKKKVQVKESKVEEIQEQPTSIAYQGNVTIKYVKDKKTLKTIRLHNSGSDLLFSFLTECLCGNFYTNRVPQFLVGYTTSSSGEISTSFNSSISFQGREATTSSATYKFIITSTNIKSGIETIDTLALFNSLNNNSTSSLDNACAIFTLDSESVIDVTDLKAGINIVILWELQLGNGTII